MNEGCSLISIPPAADVAAIQDSAIQCQESGGASTYPGLPDYYTWREWQFDLSVDDSRDVNVWW